ncbi:hypothetical protein HanRHA438_Chr04g0173031 [Helianthus annuus]|nr:hypothetical protein HanHA89_Chr04g0146981 [Helianthus annuus]KAJ0757471.1 hypothetical protein HanLR1_Chr04g0139091 [Helianthus annuus]KAJ0926595.1 hypothetical protein HanRHA438_Chr04g0173031 [Helianthus annuus]
MIISQILIFSKQQHRHTNKQLTPPPLDLHDSRQPEVTGGPPPRPVVVSDEERESRAEREIRRRERDSGGEREEPERKREGKTGGRRFGPPVCPVTRWTV